MQISVSVLLSKRSDKRIIRQSTLETRNTDIPVGGILLKLEMFCNFIHQVYEIRRISVPLQHLGPIKLMTCYI